MMRKYIVFLLIGAIAVKGISAFFVTKLHPSCFDMTQLTYAQQVMPCAIIGSGPAGIMASVYCARGGKETYLIEGHKPGGSLMDTTEVANWPGAISIQGKTIIENLKQQAIYQGVNVVNDSVVKIDTSVWPYTVHFQEGPPAQVGTLIIATGASPQRLYVPGEEKYWGSGVTSCAICDAPFFRNEDVVVVGGGDSAIEEAIQLAPFAKSITILVRKDHMRAAFSMQQRLKNYSHITIKYNVEIKEINGTPDEITHVTLYNNKTQSTELFPTRGVFLAIGHIPNSSFLQHVVKRDDQGYVKVSYPSHQTSVQGIFAAGDVEDKIYRQAGTAAGKGIEAALEAVRFLDEHGYTKEVEDTLNRYTAHTLASKDELLGSDALTELTTEDEFDSFVARHQGVVVIDFWIEECPSCKRMIPIIRKLANQMRDVSFVSINAQDLEEVANRYNIQRAPTFIILHQGSVVGRYTGYMDKEDFEKLLTKISEEKGL